MECQFTVCPFEEVKVWDVEAFLIDAPDYCDQIVSILEYIQQEHTTIDDSRLWNGLQGVIALVERLKEIAERQQQEYDRYVEEVNKLDHIVGYSKEKA